MRFTNIRMGGGIGQELGKYTKAYGFYRIALAPNEQKAWKGSFTGCWKPIREHGRYWWTWALPGTIYYLVYANAKEAHEKWRREKHH
uniref:Cytochrome b-c1 complex subunit 8 n=1 Tax=Meloidogyne javanica TaxID=6303 RepID=A0A915NDY5_MELJA